MNEDINQSTESKCVLVVDDDKTTVLLTRLFLESMSVTDVHSSSNGEEALQFMHDQCKGAKISPCPDVILLDLNMPVMDGFEFLEAYAKVKEFENKAITILVLTSSDSKRDRDRVQETHVNIAGYIVKPLTEEKIKPYLF